MAEALAGVEVTPVVKKLQVGDKTLTLKNIYPFVYDYGKGKDVLRLEVDEAEHTFTDLIVLKNNTSKIIYSEDGVQKNVYEGYSQDFVCNYKDNVYSIELTRISSTDLTVKQLNAQLNPTINKDSCTLTELKAWQINLSKTNLDNFLNTHPIKSKCHGGSEKLYSITKEKQSLLTQMIMIVQAAVNAGQTYQPSWNAQGEPCTYDWTLQELQKLAFEAEAVVRPLVSHQQTMEANINVAETKENVLAVKVEF